ncbi:uncharacterized protein LOC131159369 isoform X2 [Malania oleifera]|uniref:uncharacterized protein LOC131159369 isoform X2 n=1 Tax=Malania oleifera TaxID=397392 RepID=UPI0025AE9842|nr:uncharacterized protein LOC131159369 isoform X2 [Malania oleifera]
MDASSSQPFGEREREPCASLVDPFLVEALQNPRHRLTILRMELDIQKFMQNSNQQQFEFQHYPTSYLRLAAHRVAQHYGLQTMVQDNVIDGLGNRIVARRTAECRYPSICLSEIPAKQSENDKPENIKIAIRPRPNKASLDEVKEIGSNRCNVRTVEERKEEYDRARARIFSALSSPEPEDTMHQAISEGKYLCLCGDENDGCRNSMVDPEKSPSIRDGGTASRVAIFRDREKDRTDPDYDRSYERYVRNPLSNQSFSLAPFNTQKIQFPFVQYDTGFPQLGQMPRSQASVSYRSSSSPMMNPYATGLSQTSGDAVYMQWPSPAMMYAHSYEQFRHAVFQAPFCQQQPLSFDYSQNH